MKALKKLTKKMPSSLTITRQRKTAKRTAKKAYTASMNAFKHHPYRTLTILSLGVGVVSGLVSLIRNRD